jgi:hypothetical protein
MPTQNSNGSLNIETVCPHCGKENKAIIWPVINSIENPRITKRIIDDVLFDKKCNHCGETYYLDYTTIYRDELNDCVVYYSADDEGESLFLDTIEQELSEYEDAYDSMSTIRVVRNRNAFREKARIFSMGFDDRLVEMFKVWGLEQLREQRVTDDSINEILCWICDDGSLEISFFGKDAYMLMVPFNQYEEAFDALADFLDEVDDNEYYIDLDWAMNIIAENDL